MRFGSERDFSHMIAFNNELIQKWVDVNVIIFKVDQVKTKLNSYDEANTRVYFQGVSAPCLVNWGRATMVQDMMTINAEQPGVDFGFVRNMLWEKDFYPEVGDIILFDYRYYEINNINEIKLWIGQEDHSIEVICHTHLTRDQDLQLDMPTL